MMKGVDALIFFYGFFWALAMTGAARYEAFDTASLWLVDARGRVCRRLLWGFIVLVVLPIMWLAGLYCWVVPAAAGVCAIAIAAFASLSVFGFVRLLHALIASDSQYRNYYTECEICQVRNRGAFKQPQAFAAHFVPGIIYLLACPAVAILLGRMCQ